jgi:hypothetical protein
MHEWLLQRSRRLLLLTAVSVATGLAGCAESLEGGAGCPLLCPTEPAQLRDTVISAIELDTMLVGFPLPGIVTSVLVASRGDSLVSRGVLRFDVIPRTFAVNNSATTDSIRSIDSTFLVLSVDSTYSRGRAPVTIEAYDIDTLESDSVSAVVRTLFRPDRLLGTRTLVRDSLRDSIRVRLSDSLVAAKIRDGRRLRLGLALRSSDGAQLRVLTSVAGVAAVRVQYDPRGDTVYAPVRAQLFSETPTDNVDFANAYSAYTLAVVGSSAPPRDEWGIGGVPGRRVYLRFRIPPSIQDSSTIVRAQLLLTQRRSPSVDGTVGTTIVGYIGNATSAVTDLTRATSLASFAQDAAGLLIDTLRVAPADTGARAISVVSVVRQWAVLDKSVQRAIVLGIDQEGVAPQELRFASLEAAPAFRPRLRITYQPRRDFGLP